MAWQGSVRLLLGASCLLASLALAGCGGEPAESRGTPRALVVAGTIGPGTARDQQMRRFAGELAGIAGLESVNLQINGQLGSEETLISSVRRGRVQLASVSALSVGALVPELTGLYAAYLFDNEAVADRVLCSDFIDTVSALLGQRGLVFLGWTEIGFHHVYSRGPLQRPADLRGVRFRVGAGAAALAFPRALGADAVPLPFSEVVTGLQTGLVNAGENGLEHYLNAGIVDYASELVLTGHAYGASVLIAHPGWWNSLHPEAQAGVLEALPVTHAHRAEIRQRHAEDLARAVAARGINVIEPDEVARAQWREAGAAAREALLATIDPAAATLLAELQRRAAAADLTHPPAPCSLRVASGASGRTPVRY